MENEKTLDMVEGLTEKLGSVIDRALSDEDQFCRYIVQEKGRNADGEAVTENVERIFGKVDFKSVKEAAGAIKALADSVRDDGGEGRFSVTFFTDDDLAD